MRIRKAVITAAGRSQRSLPLQTLIDRDGVEKPVLRIIVEEALDVYKRQTKLRPGLPGVFWTGRQNARRPFVWRHQGHSTQRHRRHEEILARL